MLKGPAAVLRGNKTHFADGFIKCEKMPLAAICQKLKKEKGEVTQAHQHSIIYPYCLHKHADGSSDGLGRGYPSQATP